MTDNSSLVFIIQNQCTALTTKEFLERSVITMLTTKETELQFAKLASMSLFATFTIILITILL